MKTKTVLSISVSWCCVVRIVRGIRRDLIAGSPAKLHCRYQQPTRLASLQSPVARPLQFSYGWGHCTSRLHAAHHPHDGVNMFVFVVGVQTMVKWFSCVYVSTEIRCIHMSTCTHKIQPTPTTTEWESRLSVCMTGAVQDPNLSI